MNSIKRFFRNWFYPNPVLVRIHEAYFLNDPDKLFYFINVSNLGKSAITVTHVDFKGQPVLQPSRPLPITLHPSQVWETFVEKDEAVDMYSPYTNAVVRLSTGELIRSKKAVHVPGYGFVPGGKINN